MTTGYFYCTNRYDVDQTFMALYNKEQNTWFLMGVTGVIPDDMFQKQFYVHKDQQILPLVVSYAYCEHCTKKKLTGVECGNPICYKTKN